MAARTQLPGARWFLWLRNVSLRTGVLTGVYLSVVFLVWLIVANRLPRLESFAGDTQRCRRSGDLPAFGNSCLALPKQTHENVCFRADGMDASNFRLHRDENALHTPRNSHGGVPLLHAWRNFLRPRRGIRLGISVVRGGTAPAHGAIRAGGRFRQQVPRELIFPFPQPANLQKFLRRTKNSMKLCRFEARPPASEKIGATRTSARFCRA